MLPILIVRHCLFWAASQSQRCQNVKIRDLELMQYTIRRLEIAHKSIPRFLLATLRGGITILAFCLRTETASATLASNKGPGPEQISLNVC